LAHRISSNRRGCRGCRLLVDRSLARIWWNRFATSQSHIHEAHVIFGLNPQWLRDNRRLLFWNEGKLFLLDTELMQHREILRLEPPAYITSLYSIAADNRTIYFTQAVSESDIWMLELE